MPNNAAPALDPDDTIDVSLAPSPATEPRIESRVEQRVTPAVVVEQFDGESPELDRLVAPAVVEAPTLIGRQRPPAPLEPPPVRRRWVVPAIAVGALAVGAGAATIISGSLADGDGSAATTTTTSTPPVSSLPATLPADVSGFAPTGIDATVDGDTVVLTWQRHTDASVPQIVFVYLPDADPLQQPVEAGKSVLAISDVDVSAPMCFTVSAVLSTGTAGDVAITADSEPACINGTSAQVAAP